MFLRLAVCSFLFMNVSAWSAEYCNPQYSDEQELQNGLLFVKVRQGGARCWLELGESLSQKIYRKGRLNFRYIAKSDRYSSSVLVIKEKVIVKPEYRSRWKGRLDSLTDQISIHRPAIVSNLCKNKGARAAIGKILDSDPGRYKLSQLEPYLKYHRGRINPKPEDLAGFHFEYVQILKEAEATCIRTDDYKSGNRQAYDFIGVRRDISGDPVGTLLAMIVGMRSAIANNVFGGTEVGPQDAGYRVRHFPFSIEDDTGVATIDFVAPKIHPGMYLNIAISNLEERKFLFGHKERWWEIDWEETE